VAVLGESIIRLNRANYPVLPDTATGTGVFLLPELYYAKEKGTNRQILYSIYYVDSAPLRYDFESGVFVGGIRFLALEESYSKDYPPAQIVLTEGEEIIVSYGMESISLEINNINWPPMDVSIKSAICIDSLKVQIVTISNPYGYAKYLPVEPAIVLSSTRTFIQGFGLQTVPVYVNLKGVTSYRPINFSVLSSLGTIKPQQLTLTNDKSSEIILRSEYYGDINISVDHKNYRSNSISIKAVIPWIFLLLAVLGGLIGGLGKRLIGKGKVDLRLMTSCCIIGLIAAVAYWGLGIKLLHFAFEDRGYNEAMVLGMGLLAGYFGIKKG